MIELGSRARTQPPPPWVVWEALTDPFRKGAREWLELSDDELAPRVISAVRPNQVAWSSLWPDRPQDRVLFDIEPAGDGSMLKWTLVSDGDPPDEVRLRQLRYRLNVLINEKLSLGTPSVSRTAPLGSVASKSKRPRLPAPARQSVSASRP